MFFSTNFPSITPRELQNKLTAESLTLIDLRSHDEFVAGHISQAQNIPFAQIKDYKGSENEPVYLICQGGVRSKKAAKILKKRGYQVINVSGGMNQWRGKVTQGK